MSFVLCLLFTITAPEDKELGVNSFEANNLTTLYDAKKEWHDYRIAWRAYQNTKDQLKRSIEANKRVDNVVSRDEIQQMQIALLALEKVVHERRELWLKAVRLKIKTEKILIKVKPLPLDVYNHLKEKFPQGVFKIKLNGDDTVLLSAKAYKYFVRDWFMENFHRINLD